MSLFDELGTTGSRKHTEPPPPRPVQSLGFNRTVRHTFDYAFPLPVLPESFDVFQAPAQITKAEVTHLAIHGHPYGLWLARAAWALTVTGGGAHEYQMSSRIAGLANTVMDSGSRWADLGSLMRPAPVQIRLAPQARLRLSINRLNVILNNNPITIYVRVQGNIYTS